MNKKVIVKKNDEIVQFVIFHDEQVMNDWISMLAETKAWGSPEINEEILNENGEITINRTPSEYEVIIEDCTNEVEINKARQEALVYLASTDYKVIKSIETGIELDPEIKRLRQEARLKVL